MSSYRIIVSKGYLLLLMRMLWQQARLTEAGAQAGRQTAIQTDAQSPNYPRGFLSQYFEILLELKIVLNGGNSQFLEDFSFIITSQHFHPTRIKMYSVRLFLKLHTCSISKKYCADLVFKALTLLELKYFKALASPIFSFPSRSNSSFLISKITCIAYVFSIFQAQLSPSCLHLSTALPTRGMLLHEDPSSSLPDETKAPHNSSINTNRFDYPATAKYFSVNHSILSPVTPKILLNVALPNHFSYILYLCMSFPLHVALSFYLLKTLHFFLFRSFLPINVMKMLYSNRVFPNIQYSSQDDVMYKYIHYYFTQIINENIKWKEWETFLLL